MLFLQIDPIDNPFTQQAFNIKQDNALGYLIAVLVTLLICFGIAIVYLERKKSKDRDVYSTSLLAQQMTYTSSINEYSKSIEKLSVIVSQSNGIQERTNTILDKLSTSITKIEATIDNVNNTLNLMRGNS